MVFNAVEVDDDPIVEISLPFIQKIRAYLSQRGASIIRVVGEGDLDHLRNGAWVYRPHPKVECLGILPARRSTFKALHGAFSNDGALGEV